MLSFSMQFVESDSEDWWYLETAAGDDESRKQMYVKSKLFGDQKMYFYITYDGDYRFRLGAGNDVVVRTTDIFRFNTFNR